MHSIVGIIVCLATIIISCHCHATIIISCHCLLLVYTRTSIRPAFWVSFLSEGSREPNFHNMFELNLKMDSTISELE